MAVDIKQSARRLIEEPFGKGNLDVIDQLCDPGYRGHDPMTGELDREGFKDLARMYRAAFPDLKCTILASCAEGDTCVTHWRMTGTHRGKLMGLEPTGKRVTVEGMSFAKFRGGKLAEDWTQWDALGLYRQLGVTPALTEQGATPEAQPHA